MTRSVERRIAAMKGEPAPQFDGGKMSGLVCGVCGAPWKLGKPLLYHHDQLHCDSHACSRECEECRDWEHAIEKGAAEAHVRPAEASQDKTMPDAAPVGSFDKAPGYAAMMEKIKRG